MPMFRPERLRSRPFQEQPKAAPKALGRAGAAPKARPPPPSRCAMRSAKPHYNSA
ncbi:hypothetical protein EPIB1_2574 [Tritonibacter mobilis]|nr:hypothetical protein EPIB1_2574 [Tritonibacter mobilis]